MLSLLLNVALATATLAQNAVKVTGKVFDDKNEPMIGVSVLEKGTQNATVSDLDGNYAISVKSGATLVFSYIGCETKEAVVKGSRLNVTLREDARQLDDVVVVGYGAQAGNGVVLITTKRGKATERGYGSVTYDLQISSQSLAHKPKTLNAEQYIDYLLEAGVLHSLTEVYQKGWNGYTNTDWSDVAFEPSLIQKHNLAVQGANDRGAYYASLTCLYNNGIVKGNSDTYRRYTATINGDYKIKPWLKAGTNNQIEYYQSKSVAASGIYGNIMSAVLQLDPLTPDVVSADNLPANMKELLATGQTLLQNSDGDYYSISNFYDSEQIHPMILRDKTTSKTTGFNVNGAIYADFQPIKELVVTSRFGYRLNSYHTPTYSHKYYGSSSSGTKYIGISATTYNSIYYQWENFANFHKTFAKNHDVTAMVGMSFAKTVANSTTGSLSGNDDVGDAVQKDDVYGFGDLNYGKTGATKGVSGGTSEATQMSYFGRVGYSYKNKYMAQFSLRADAYDLSKLPKSNRWGCFPAFSLGWDLTQ